MATKPTTAEKLAKCSPQTQEDVRALVALIRSNTEWARAKYIELIEARGWNLGEATAIKSLAFEIAKP